MLRFRLMVKREVHNCRPQASEGEAQHGVFCGTNRRFSQGDERLHCGLIPGRIMREVEKWRANRRRCYRFDDGPRPALQADYWLEADIGLFARSAKTRPVNLLGS